MMKSKIEKIQEKALETYRETCAQLGVPCDEAMFIEQFNEHLQKNSKHLSKNPSKLFEEMKKSRFTNAPSLLRKK